MSKKTRNSQYNFYKSFPIFHCNLISIYAHNFIKLSLLHTFIMANQCDILCLSETFVNSGILSDDVDLDIPGYNLVIAEHSSNAKGGGLFIFRKLSLQKY